MRKKGHGTIERHRGKLRVRLTLPDGTRRAITIPDEYTAPDEIELFRAQCVEALAGTIDDPLVAGRTLGAHAARWLERRHGTHRDADGDAQRWGAYLAGTPLAAMKLDALTPAAVLRWGRSLVARKSRSGEPIARSTAQNAWRTLRACLRDAIDAIEVDRAAAILALELPASPVRAAVELDERIEWLRAAELARVLALEVGDDDDGRRVDDLGHPIRRPVRRELLSLLRVLVMRGGESTEITAEEIDCATLDESCRDLEIRSMPAASKVFRERVLLALVARRPVSPAEAEADRNFRQWLARGVEAGVLPTGAESLADDPWPPLKPTKIE